MDNPWTNINWENTVADCDKKVITPDYCEKHGIDISLLPEPYTGNPRSNVVCLNLNPGIGRCDACFKFNRTLLEETQSTLSHATDHSMWLYGDIKCDKEVLHEGCEWWRKRTKELREAIFPMPLNMFVIEFFPYHSEHTFNFPKLESDEYRNYLLTNAIRQDKLIVIMRGKKKWYDIDQDIKNALKSHEERGRVIEISNPQNVSFTKNNLKKNNLKDEEAWNLLVKELSEEISSKSIAEEL